MDDRQFDELARRTARLTTRRGTFQVLAAAFGIGLGMRGRPAAALTCHLVGEPCSGDAKSRCCAGAVCNEDQPGGGICSCPQPLTNCRGFCVDVQTNPAACGPNCQVCPDDTDCCNGVCCPAGQRCCGGTCVDLTADHNNCGGCTQQCPADLTCCDSRCRVISGDPRHCGACGHVCEANQECANSQCVCKVGYTDCGDGVCRNLKRDRKNCGRCGHACGAKEFCKNGRCRRR